MFNDDMFSKGPKNTSQHYWTEHAKFKMQFYGLSAQKILGVISKPARKEDGIVKNTVAVMKPVNPKIVDNKTVWKQEVWVMYQRKAKNHPPAGEAGNSNVKTAIQNPKLTGKNQIRIISAWRYPGVSPKRNPIPGEILDEISKII